MISQVTHTLGPFCLLQCLLQEPCLLEILEKVCQRDTSSHHTFPIIYLSNILTISLFTPCNILPLIDPQKFLKRDLADAVGSFQTHPFCNHFEYRLSESIDGKEVEFFAAYELNKRPGQVTLLCLFRNLLTSSNSTFQAETKWKADDPISE